MTIEEKEQQETLLKDLIEKIEKDPLPTNIYDVENTDPLVLLGKLNEIVAKLKAINALIASSDNKADEAVKQAISALSKAGEAFAKALHAEAIAKNNETIAENAEDKANLAIVKANEANTKAEEANEQAQTANDTAGDALAEADTALQTARQALEQVTESLGTKVYDNHGNLMNTAKFTGHNGINVDMNETDPETFDIRLDNSITTAIEENHTQGQTNKAEIEKVKTDATALVTRVTANEADIVEATEMLSATEELAQNATEDIVNLKNKNSQQDTAIANCVTLNNEQTITGKKFFRGNIEVGNNGANVGTKFSTDNQGVLNITTAGSTINGAVKINNKFLNGWVVESGLNYVRFSNGTQICWGENETSASGKYTITFAKPFSNGTYKVLFGQGRGGASASDFWNSYRVLTRNTSNFIYEPGQREKHQCFWFAIGRW